jgi:sigma-B regulation protein RsbU (phosphoserine phosphatase)
MLFSIRVKIISIVLVFLSLISTAFVIYSINTTGNLKALRLEGIQRLVDFETEKVNKVIAEIEKAAVFFAIGSIFAFDAQLEGFGEILVVEYLKSFPTVIGGGFWYAPYAYRKDQLRAGFYAFFDKENKKVRLDDTFFMDEYDYHNTSWYLEITESLKHPYQVVWTKPYVDDSGTYSLMTTAGAGVFDENGNLFAISTVDWEINELIKNLFEISPTRNSFTILCVPAKDYIISSTYDTILKGDSIDEFPFDIYADSFILNGINYMNFGRYMDNGWLLTILIPQNDIFYDIERRNNQYSVTILMTLIFMLFTAFFSISAFINKPIKKLIEDVARIALGNLDAQIKIQSNDELGQLAKTFNKMKADLKKSIEENVLDREEKKRINTELTVANEIQTSMLPCVFPAFPDRDEFDLYASMLPARNVGGDFYDFFFIDKDNLALVIADVSGKGVPAALFMAISKILIKYSSTGSAGLGKNPQEVFRSVNNKLCEGNEAGMFVTAFMGVYNIPTGRFTYVNAGHNPPFLKKGSSLYKNIETTPCYVLAFMENTDYKQEEIILEDGDILYLYTDGVTEAMNNEKTLFGDKRLLDTLNNCNAETAMDIVLAVKNELNKFSDGAEQADDITMLALKIGYTAKKIILDASLKNLGRLLEFINEELEKNEFPKDTINEIDIAVEEIFVNIVNYAYENGEGNISIEISALNEAVITFEDNGIPFNPLEKEPPNLDLDIIDRNIGGLGIFMTRKIMDNMKYTRHDFKNILTITKKHPQK